jgi:uncharacterized DUF497 family protein
MRIEKSAAKEHSNVRKHGIDFSFAEHIFTDPLAVTVYDRFENSEHRWHTFSWVGGMLLIVVHTFPDPDDGQRVRVIGLRKATAQERTRYERGDFG